MNNLETLWDRKPVVNIHGFDEQSRFDRAFVLCLKHGVYPGPTEINKRRAPLFKKFNRLNGRMTSRRLQLMTWFGIPYQRGWGMTMQGLDNKGQLPFPESKYANTLSVDDFKL